MYTETPALTYTQTHTRRRTHIHMYTHTNAHTHTHTCKYGLRMIGSCYLLLPTFLKVCCFRKTLKPLRLIYSDDNEDNDDYGLMKDFVAINTYVRTNSHK